MIPNRFCPLKHLTSTQIMDHCFLYQMHSPSIYSSNAPCKSSITLSVYVNQINAKRKSLHLIDTNRYESFITHIPDNHYISNAITTTNQQTKHHHMDLWDINLPTKVLLKSILALSWMGTDVSFLRWFWLLTTTTPGSHYCCQSWLCSLFNYVSSLCR